MMSGVYIHIPFCRSKCGYCGFYSVASERDIVGFEDYIAREAEFRKGYIADNRIDTIYFGGGTPTMLNINQIETIMNALQKHYRVEDGAEITIEANPDTLNREYLKALREMGINRLSIGIQSFETDDLLYLGRKHNVDHAVEAVAMSRETGFDNVSIDLIYNIPTQSIKKLESNLEKAVSMGVCHISAYSLTIEENSLLKRNIERGRLSDISDNDFDTTFEFLHNYLTENGFRHYEVSNFASGGRVSRHNSKYWADVPYVGLGPSAHSYDGETRQWNAASLLKYKEGIDSGLMACEKEQLSEDDRYNEYIMTRMRTDRGVSREEVVQRYCNGIAMVFAKALQRNMAFFDCDDRLRVKHKHWNIIDTIILDFIKI